MPLGTEILSCLLALLTPAVVTGTTTALELNPLEVLFSLLAGICGFKPPKTVASTRPGAFLVGGLALDTVVTVCRVVSGGR